MDPIPNTGGGLSGFIAYLVWHVYRYFPFEGTWDWLLLFVFLAVAVRVVHLPFLWKLVKADMKMFASGREDPRRRLMRRVQYWGWAGWSIICSVAIYVWICATPAGQTFLRGRPWCHDASPGEITPSNDIVGWQLLWFLVLLVGSYFACAFLLDVAYNRDKKSGRRRGPHPCSKRDLPTLMVGGGVDVTGFDENGEPKYDRVVNLTFIYELIAYLPIYGLVLGRLTVESDVTPRARFLILFLFLVSRILGEGVRMLFVYIHHKRTFA